MGRAPCCDKVGLKKGRWTAQEDRILINYINQNSKGSWRSLPKNAGLLRCGKSCRLRWINYLRSDLKRGNFTSLEEDIIIKLQASHGNKWSLIANRLPGRTDNEIKNYWNSTLGRRIDSFRSMPSSTRVAGALSQSLTSNLASEESGEVLMRNNNGPVAAAVQGVILKKRGGKTSRAAMQKNKSSTNDRSNKTQQVALAPHACESNPNINSITSGTGHLSRSSSSSLISCSHGYRSNLPQTSNEGRLLLPAVEAESRSSSSYSYVLESLVLDSVLAYQNDCQRPPVDNQNDDESVKLDAISRDMSFDGLVKFVDDDSVRMDDDPCGINYTSVNRGDREVTMGSLLDSPFQQAADFNITRTSPGFVECALAGGADWDWENIFHQHVDQIWLRDSNQQQNNSSVMERNLTKDEEHREAMVAWLLS